MAILKVLRREQTVAEKLSDVATKQLELMQNRYSSIQQARIWQAAKYLVWSGVPIRQVANAFGVTPVTIYKWIDKAKAENINEFKRRARPWYDR